MNDKLVRSTVQRRFSAAAPTYDEHATVQAKAADKLVSLLPATPDPVRILEVGCGTGILTQLLLRHFPNASIDAIDISEKMIAQARRRLGHHLRASWRAADARTYRGPEPYSFIVSNCALHWMDPLADGLANLASQLDRQGHFVFSLMLNGTLYELHESRLRAAPKKPPLGRLPVLAEVIDALTRAGCSIERSAEDTQTDYHASALDFLRAIHELGLTGGAVSRSSVPLSRVELSNLMTEYESQYRTSDGRIPASYKIGYIRAVRGNATRTAENDE